jgi:hypothetical protein
MVKFWFSTSLDNLPASVPDWHGIFTKLSVHVGDRNPKFSTLYMAVSQCLGLSRRLAIFATVAAASALSRGERPIRSA